MNRREKQNRNPVEGEDGEAGNLRNVHNRWLSTAGVSGALRQEGRPTFPSIISE